MAVMICMTSFSFTAFADSESAADEILQTEAEKYELPEITYVKQKRTAIITPKFLTKYVRETKSFCSILHVLTTLRLKSEDTRAKTMSLSGQTKTAHLTSMLT